MSNPSELSDADLDEMRGAGCLKSICVFVLVLVFISLIVFLVLLGPIAAVIGLAALVWKMATAIWSAINP